MADDARPSEPDDDEVLDIELEDLDEEPLPPVPPEQPALEITLDDLEAESPEALPPVTAEQAMAAQPGLTIGTVCSSTGQAFAVRYVEQKPRLFVATEVLTGDAAAAAGGAGATAQVEGEFGMTADYQCPYCGNRVIIQCGHCGLDVCGGGLRGKVITCPGCKSQMQVGGHATSATGTLGGKKGK